MRFTVLFSFGDGVRTVIVSCQKYSPATVRKANVLPEFVTK